MNGASIETDYFLFNYGELIVTDYESLRISVRDRSVPLFLDPEYFPLYVGDCPINLNIRYAEGSEKMSVQRIRHPDFTNGISIIEKVEEEASMEVYDMNTFQKHAAFLYLVGCVRNEG